MPGDRQHAEPGLEATEKGLGKRDFREQHEALPLGPQRSGDGLEIDLGLARARDPVEQKGLKRSPFDGSNEAASRLLLSPAGTGVPKLARCRMRDQCSQPFR